MSCYNNTVSKESKKLQRIFKGVANHRRIDILRLINRSPAITLHLIAEKLDCNFKTISEHTKKLVIAGLINKRYQGNSVIHTLSPYGKKMVKVLQLF